MCVLQDGHIMHAKYNICFEAKPDRSVVLSRCRLDDPYQLWTFRNYSTAYHKLVDTRETAPHETRLNLRIRQMAVSHNYTKPADPAGKPGEPGQSGQPGEPGQPDRQPESKKLYEYLLKNAKILPPDLQKMLKREVQKRDLEAVWNTWPPTTATNERT